MNDPELAWKLVNLLWGALFALIWALGKHVWSEVSALKEKVHEMELNAVTMHVSKADMEHAFSDLVKHHIAPLNRDIGIIIRALAAQEIHLEHPRE